MRGVGFVSSTFVKGSISLPAIAEEPNMIDLRVEEVFSLSEACRRLPPRREGKKPHVATLYRWGQRGLRGVCLETIQVGGTLCTSLVLRRALYEDVRVTLI